MGTVKIKGIVIAENNNGDYDKVLTIFISQSGETADTLAALRLARGKKSKTIAI